MERKSAAVLVPCVFVFATLLSCGGKSVPNNGPAAARLAQFVAEKVPDWRSPQAQKWVDDYAEFLKEARGELVREGVSSQADREYDRRREVGEKIADRAREIARQKFIDERATYMRALKPLISSKPVPCQVYRDLWMHRGSGGYHFDHWQDATFAYVLSPEDLHEIEGIVPREVVLHYLWEHLNTRIPSHTEYFVWIHGCGYSDNHELLSVIDNFHSKNGPEVALAIYRIAKLVDEWHLTRKELESWGFKPPEIETIRKETGWWKSWWRLRK